MVTVFISCSSRDSSDDVWLYDVYPSARKWSQVFESVREAFGVDTVKYGLPHKVGWANIHNAWLASKVNLEVKTRVDAVARAHGQPIQYLTKDWASTLFQFKTQYGLNIHEAKLPSQSYYEERLHNGVIEA